MSKFQALTIELGVAGCLMTIVLWIPFINILPRVVGIMILWIVFWGVGIAARVYIEDKYE